MTCDQLVQCGVKLSFFWIKNLFFVFLLLNPSFVLLTPPHVFLLVHNSPLPQNVNRLVYLLVISPKRGSRRFDCKHTWTFCGKCLQNLSPFFFLVPPQYSKHFCYYENFLYVDQSINIKLFYECLHFLHPPVLTLFLHFPPLLFILYSFLIYKTTQIISNNIIHTKNPPKGPPKRS